jgi:hypothetical protein
MTEKTSLPDAKRDGKAQAAAEKAYRKASRPWFKKKRFLFPLILLVIIIIFSATSGGDNAASNSEVVSSGAENASKSGDDSSDAAEKPAADAKPAFPGAQSSDAVGSAGDAIKIGPATVTASPIKAGDSTLGKTLCTSTTLSNGSDETIQFNAFDWKLQDPAGTIVTTSFAGSDDMLSTGEIAPGGKAKGDVCFDNKSNESGQFVLIYEPVFSFFSDRAAWINKF